MRFEQYGQAMNACIQSYGRIAKHITNKRREVLRSKCSRTLKTDTESILSRPIFLKKPSTY